MASLLSDQSPDQPDVPRDRIASASSIARTKAAAAADGSGAAVIGRPTTT
jgi:hypothetical protein